MATSDPTAVLDAPGTATRLARPGAGDGGLPRASVVVPVLDAADGIDALLDSLEALDYPSDRIEIIVVDNGSTDGTAERVARRSVRLLHERRIQSSYAARNRGVEAASGDWVAFTDADCVAPSDWLRRLLAPGLPDDAGAVAGEVLALESATPVQRLTERFGIMKHAVTMPHKALPCFSTANVAVRRELLRALGGFREDVRFFGDMELSWRMQIASGARIVFRPDAVIRHRHRRTWRALWRHGRQHGRGVAFMKNVYPDRYRIRLGEQVGRVGAIGREALRALTGRGGRARDASSTGGRQGQAREAPPEATGRTTSGSRGLRRDRVYAPVFLTIWYGGMAAGYLMGPAWSAARVEQGANPRRSR